MIKLYSLLLALVLFLPVETYAAKSTLLTQATTAERDAIVSPKLNQVVYNITVKKLQYWNGSAWVDSAAAAANAGGATTQVQLNISGGLAGDANFTYNPATNNLTEGYNSTATGGNAHAEGQQTAASGNASHSEGLLSIASGIGGSHAEGGSSTASGQAAHSEGFHATAAGRFSHAGGWGTFANGDNQTAIGSWNIPVGTPSSPLNSDEIFTVGNGVFGTPATTFSILRSGTVNLFSHSLINVLNPVNPQDAATKNYVDTASASGANTFLSNLANPTSIGQGLFFNVDSIVSSEGHNTDVLTKDMLFASGDNTAASAINGTGNVSVRTGTIPTGNGGVTGTLVVKSGDGGGTNATSGDATFGTGNSIGAQSGTSYITTGDSNQNTGNIGLLVGTSGALRGKIVLDGRETDVLNLDLIAGRNFSSEWWGAPSGVEGLLFDAAGAGAQANAVVMLGTKDIPVGTTGIGSVDVMLQTGAQNDTGNTNITGGIDILTGDNLGTGANQGSGYMLLGTGYSAGTFPTGGMYITTGDNGGGSNTGDARFLSGNIVGPTTPGNTGTNFVASGNAGIGNSGAVRMYSGPSVSGNSGAADFFTGQAGGTSGGVSLGTGPAVTGSGGNDINTGITSTGASGPINIHSGVANAASGSVQVVSGASTGAISGNSGAVYVESGQSTSGVSGAVFISSGNSLAAAHATGALHINTGESMLGGTTGGIQIQTGNPETAIGASGDIRIIAGREDTAPFGGSSSGNVVLANAYATGNGNTGNISAVTGNTVNGTSGTLNYATGAATGTGNSGDINFSVGTINSGSRGKIKLVDGSEGNSGDVWKSIDSAGHGHWAPVLVPPLTTSITYTSNFWASPGATVGVNSNLDQTNKLMQIVSTDTAIAANSTSDIFIGAGDNTNASATGQAGGVYLQGGNIASGSGNAGSIAFIAGSADSASGGSASFQGGNSNTGAGGSLNVNGGNANAGTQVGGTVQISSGSSAGGAAGNVNIIGGTGAPNGSVALQVGAGAKIKLQDSSTGTVGHVWTSTDGFGGGHWADAPYVPANPGYWVGTPPATVKEALDRLAAVVSVSGGTPIP